MQGGDTTVAFILEYNSHVDHRGLTSIVSLAGWFLSRRRSALSCTDLITSSFSSNSLIRSCMKDAKLSISVIQSWQKTSHSILLYSHISCLSLLSMKLII